MKTLIENLRKLLVHASVAEVVSVVVAIFAVSALEGLGIGLIVPIVSFAADPESSDKFPFIARMYEAGGFAGSTQFLLALLAGLCLFFVFKNAVFILATYWQARFTLQNGATLSREMLRLYMRSPYPSHLRRDSAKSLVLVHDFIGQVFFNYLLSALMLFTEAVVTVAVLAVLLFNAPYVTLSAVVILGTGSGIFYLAFGTRFKELGERSADLAKQSMVAIRDGLASVKEARVLGRAAFFHDRYGEIKATQARVLTTVSTLSVLPRSVTEILAMLAVLTVVAMMLLGDYPAAEIPALLGMFAVAALRIVPSANRILFFLNKIRISEPFLDQVVEEYDELLSETERGPAPAQFRPLEFENSLDLENASFSYPDRDHAAVKDITLHIGKGESVALVGPSGAGKTTLGDMILGLLPPSSGRMSVDGADVYANLPAWHGRVGYVPQAIHILNTTLRKNVAFAIPDDDIDDEAVMRAIRMSHMEEVLADLPDGLDTMLGEQGVRLSGGQRQRVGIARALYHDPELLVLDEATSALDSGTERAITRAIDDLARAKTIVVIAHRLSTVRHCDRLYFLKEGRVAASGPFDELLLGNEDFRRMAEDADVGASGESATPPPREHLSR